ncbi:MAG: hypothetical protein HZB51_26820 [Chloroflexi bacterium]|nr:hypothetical protein [Chloroflexota bacterium]
MSSVGTVSRPASVSNTRSIIFGVLTISGIGLLLYSWFQPWWQAYIVALSEIAVVIRPWGLVSYMPQEYSKWLVGAEMPSWFGPLMWVYAGAAVGTLVYSMFVSEEQIRLGKFKMSLQKALIALVGLSYIVFVVVCVIVISIRAKDFYGASVMGTINVSFSDHEVSDVDTGLLSGYWIAASVGPLLVVLAFLREKILGIRKSVK